TAPAPLAEPPSGCAVLPPAVSLVVCTPLPPFAADLSKAKATSEAEEPEPVVPGVASLPGVPTFASCDAFWLGPDAKGLPATAPGLAAASGAVWVSAAAPLAAEPAVTSPCCRANTFGAAPSGCSVAPAAVVAPAPPV